jgi:hypothetical protein
MTVPAEAPEQHEVDDEGTITNTELFTMLSAVNRGLESNEERGRKRTEQVLS